MSWLKLEVLSIMGCYGFVVGILLLGRWQLKRKSSAHKSAKTSGEGVKDLTVIIPFRNEKENLKSLIYFINNLKRGPMEFIFVNDHSEDDSLDVLINTNWKYSVSVIDLPENLVGKKAAIKHGISESKGKYILTWDADIYPSENYFNALDKQEWKSLNILPVEMRDSGWIAGFFAWDYQLQTQTALSVSGWNRPITASGANLLFEKEAFLALEKSREDENILSGDDQFLLSAFRNSGRAIANLLGRDVSVTTNSPQTISDGLNQRSRWLGKSKAVKDHFANLFGLLVLFIQLSYYLFAFDQLWMGNFGATIVMILIKAELDAFICTYKFQEQFNTLQVFVYELLFPIYIISLIFKTQFGANTWKGRTIKKPF